MSAPMTREEARLALLAHFKPGRQSPVVRIRGSRAHGYVAGLAAPRYAHKPGGWDIAGRGGNLETAVYCATTGCRCGGTLRGYIFHGVGYCCSVADASRREEAPK